MKRLLLACWSVEAHVRAHVRCARWCHRYVPLIGGWMALALDRLMLIVYGLDLWSPSIDVFQLSVSHPGGILLGGNGLHSPGRVAIMSGVKLVGRSPDDPRYQERLRTRRVFSFGDNVVIGANSVVVGPVDICSNVVVGAMSLVNADITEPGVYVGSPVRRVSERVDDAWVRHLTAPERKEKEK